MDKMKTFFMYTLFIIGFIILSEFLINVGLNSNYKQITRKDENTSIVVYQAEATYVNGRIRGIIKDFTDKYLEIELYSKRNVLMGRSYIEITKNNSEEPQPFELLFKATDVAYYKVNTVDEKKEGAELEIIPKEWTKPEIILATAIAFLIFWG